MLFYLHAYAARSARERLNGLSRWPRATVRPDACAATCVWTLIATLRCYVPRALPRVPRGGRLAAKISPGRGRLRMRAFRLGSTAQPTGARSSRSLSRSAAPCRVGLVFWPICFSEINSCDNETLKGPCRKLFFYQEKKYKVCAVFYTLIVIHLTPLNRRNNYGIAIRVAFTFRFSKRFYGVVRLRWTRLTIECFRFL